MIEGKRHSSGNKRDRESISEFYQSLTYHLEIRDKGEKGVKGEYEKYF